MRDLHGGRVSSEKRELVGRTAVVTGSSSGIGEAILRELADAGAEVIAHASASFERAESLAREIAANGGTARALAADLRSVEESRRLVDAAFAASGRVDIWVNNAGADILTGRASRLEYLEKLELLLAVDLRATMLLTREVGRRMRARGSGVIINLGWDQAETGMEGDSGELFAAVKGGIMSFTRSAALTLAPEVRVNCIAPGWIRTAWGREAPPAWQERVLRETPVGRWGEAGDVARAARFLVSPEAGFLTGQVLRVNGGAVR